MERMWVVDVSNTMLLNADHVVQMNTVQRLSMSGEDVVWYVEAHTTDGQRHILTPDYATSQIATDVMVKIALGKSVA